MAALTPHAHCCLSVSVCVSLSVGSESLMRGWYLLNLCFGSLPPSESLFPYLRQFLLRTVALEGTHPCHEIAVDAQVCPPLPPPYTHTYKDKHRHCHYRAFADDTRMQVKLERTRLNGARRFPPIPLEIDCLEVRSAQQPKPLPACCAVVNSQWGRLSLPVCLSALLQRKMPIALRVYFPDSSSRSLIMDSATVASELVRQIGRKLDADAQLWTGFGIFIEADDFGAPVPTHPHAAHPSISGCHCAVHATGRQREQITHTHARMKALLRRPLFALCL
jgi:hypothetical protein